MVTDKIVLARVRVRGGGGGLTSFSRRPANRIETPRRPTQVDSDFAGIARAYDRGRTWPGPAGR